VISLASITQIRPISDVNEIDSSLSKTGEGVTGCFVLCTPIRTYHLKAKHDIAMNSWIQTIQELYTTSTRSQKQVSAPRSEEKEVSGGTEVNIIGGEKIILEYSENGKKKSYNMKKKSIVIGRSSKANLILCKDMKISRNHAKIELNNAGIPILYDLGSLSGSLLNGAKIEMAPLNHGDIMTFGETEISFQVKDAK